MSLFFLVRLIRYLNYGKGEGEIWAVRARVIDAG
jgi:hypothetical protein